MGGLLKGIQRSLWGLPKGILKRMRLEELRMGKSLEKTRR